MSFHNQELELGDLVQTVWTNKDGQPSLTGIVVGFAMHNQRLDVIKAKVLWNEIGVRIEFFTDLRRIN